MEVIFSSCFDTEEFCCSFVNALHPPREQTTLQPGRYCGWQARVLAFCFSAVTWGLEAFEETSGSHAGVGESPSNSRNEEVSFEGTCQTSRGGGSGAAGVPSWVPGSSRPWPQPQQRPSDSGASDPTSHSPYVTCPYSCCAVPQAFFHGSTYSLPKVKN